MAAFYTLLLTILTLHTAHAFGGLPSETFTNITVHLVPRECFLPIKRLPLALNYTPLSSQTRTTTPAGSRRSISTTAVRTTRFSTQASAVSFLRSSSRSPRIQSARLSTPRSPSSSGGGARRTTRPRPWRASSSRIISSHSSMAAGACMMRRRRIMST